MKARFIYAEWEYIPEGWSYKRKEVKGWNINSIVETQVTKWKLFQEAVKAPKNFAVNHEANDYTHPDVSVHNLLMSYCYVCALAAKNGKLDILDWGGGLGHYGIVANECLPGVEVNYSCFDLPVFKKAVLENYPEAFFVDGLDALANKQFDLINVSSSLWYDAEWKNTLKQLTTNTASYLYVTRMIFIEKSDSYVAIQRPYTMGYKTEYLFWVFNQNELINYVRSLGFELLREFYLSEAPEIYKAPEQGSIKGFLFKKNG